MVSKVTCSAGQAFVMTLIISPIGFDLPGWFLFGILCFLLDFIPIIGALFATIPPVIIGFVLGPKALGGMLGGALICCVMMALMMSNAGGAWDNAKKFVEKGNFGGKGSDVHKAAVVGDTVGDPLKDTSGPSMNILINVMAIVSLVIAPLLI